MFIAFGVTGRCSSSPPTALIGEPNWYLPRWLDRALPHIRFSH